ncbi:Zinc finger protein [Fasciola gigantica]|uniref:Zinc finger protein n=1 Tax=Fasciola gigantica TaxID=46835 RepID=A0A504YXP3_FASGI|nr:Zinc finger protein [Fasciola gigantica]
MQEECESNGHVKAKALESIETQNPRAITVHERCENKLNRVPNKTESKPCAQQINACKRKSIQSISESQAKRAASVSQNERITIPIDISPEAKDPQKSASVGDVKDMQEALIISQKLEILKRQQTELETQLHDIQTKLNDVKTKQRDLKAQRNNLLRGLVRSESDEDNNSLDVSISASEQSTRSYRPSGNTNVPMVVSVNPIQSHAHVISTQPSQQWSSNLSSPAFSTVNPKIPYITSVVSSSPVCAVPSSVFAARPSVGFVQPGVVVPPLITQPPSSVPSSGPPGVDLERLALIRQALQSPDSWQFTFEDVDRMLQQTAAKVGANAPTQIEVSTQSHATPTVQTSELPQLPLPTVTVQPTYEPPIQVKGEPTDCVHPSAVNVQSFSSRTEPQVLKPTTFTPTSSSSFDSSEDENSVNRPPVHKTKRLVKPDPLQPTFYSSSAPVPHIESCSPSKSSPISKAKNDVSKDLVKFGEFHAFDGQTTAVIDMVVHRPSWSIFVGGQSGSVAQFDLKSHVCLRRIVARDASVTQMVLEPLENSLFVGYYDNYFAEFSVATGSLLFEKYFAQRIEVIAAPPVRDVSYLYLGMSNGDILRHDIRSRVVSVLYDRSLHGTGPVDTSSSAGISSMAVIQSSTRLLLIVGDQERNLTIHAASDGSHLLLIRSSPHKGPPQRIATLPASTLFCAYSERSVRIHNWRTGTGIMTLQTQKVTSSCVSNRYLAIGDSEGAVRVHKLQGNGLPHSRPMKVYFAGTRAAITSLVSCGEALIAGSLDGSVTTIWVNEPAKNHVCLYGPFGHNCGIGFDKQEDLIKHVLDTHLIFGSNKSIMCRWGGGRCRVRFSDTKSIKAIRDHLLTHMPD